MDSKDQSPEKKPLSDIDYDVISVSNSPLDEKCEKLLPDDYDCNIVIRDGTGEEDEGGTDGGEEEGEGGEGCGGGCGGGGKGRRGGREDGGGKCGGGTGEDIGADMAGVGHNNNDCKKKQKTNNSSSSKNNKDNNKSNNKSNSSKKGKNCKVTIVQPANSKEVTTKKMRKNSREPEIRDTNLVLSLFVLFCFNLPFGLLATMFSLMAGSAFRDGKKKKAKCHSRTSMVISLLGIATTAALVMCVIFFLAIKEQSQGY